MDERFTEAWVNRDDWIVYGRRLHPFCLYDLFFLALDQNAAYFGDSPTQEDLLAAVLVCSSKYEDLQAGRVSLKGFRRTYWMHKCKRVSFVQELLKFRAYLKDFDSRPQFWESASGESMRAPALLSVATFLELKTNMTESEIWTAPIGKMFWKSAAIAEIEGVTSSQIVTPDEAKFIDEMEKEAQANG